MELPIWKSRTLYSKGDIVKHGEKVFECQQNHVSIEDFDKGRFNRIKADKLTDEPRDLELTNGKKFALITSMDKRYYTESGKAMLQSWKRHASGLGTMYCYNEQLFDPKVKGVKTAGWMLGEEFIKFQKRHTNHKIKGFAKKAFPIIDATQKFSDHDRLLWVDADAVFTENFPRLLTELIAPDDVLSTHFSVWHEKNGKEYHSCETGFFILNMKHPGFEEFIDLYKDIYYNDKAEEYELRRFYDGEVYGKCVELMEAKGHKMMNLNTGRHKTPISRSLLAPYLSHFKAGLKERVDFSEYEYEEEV
jgi:hypothetical protein